MNLVTGIVGLAEILLFLGIQIHHVSTENALNRNSSLDPRIADFKLNLHRLMEGTRIREKRRVQKLDGPPGHQMRVGSSSQENLPYLSDFRLTFWVPVEHESKRQVLIGTIEGHLILFEISEVDDRIGKMIALSQNEDVASKAMAFSHYDEQWFVLLQSSANKTWIRFYQRIGRGIERRQMINLEGEADFNLLSMKGVHYLAVSTFQRSRNQVVLYHWTESQFDIIATRSIYGARSITCWVMDGTLYFAIAQEMDEGGNFNAGSPIFLYNSKDGSGLLLLEIIATYGPKKVLYFYVSGSHYIIFIGRLDAAIYWWSSDQFLLWQSIDGTANASDVAVLALDNGEVVIVIALKEEALFLTLDASGRYYVSFTMLLSGFNLASLQFMYSGKAYYALALSGAHLAHRPQSVWKLTLSPYSIPTGSSLGPLQQCTKDVTEILGHRQTEMNTIHADLERVWLKDKNQTITVDVIVTGKTSSPQVNQITEVLVVTDHKILPDSSLSQVANGIVRLKSIADGIQQNIRNSVLKSVSQEIKGTKHFHDSVSIPSLIMESTNIDVPINGVPVSRIHHHALRKVGNQTFENPASVGNIYSERISTEFLNGIPVDDILLLKGEQEISGVLKFTNMHARELVVGNINSISVDNFVTTSSNQLLRDLKSMSVLQALVVDVHGQTNGEDLKEFVQKIVARESYDEIKGRCILESPVHIYGDAFVTGSVNGMINIPQLALNSVTKHTNQDLMGYFTFTLPHHILGDINISGHVNAIDISHLMTLSTDQLVGGNVVFDELLTINRDLIVDYVNGLSLEQTAVRKIIEDQFILGFKVFAEKLTVDFIDMTEFVTLDGVDPSFLVQDIVKHKEGVVKNNGTVFHNVVVLGNVTAVEGINGHDVFDLPYTVWLRSTPQAVEVPVNIIKVSVKQDLDVTVVNNLHMDGDLVHIFGDETIISIKSFVHDISVTEKVHTETGAMINGFDVISFQKEMGEYITQGTVHGKKTLQRLEIFGDIEADSLNGFPANDIVLSQVYQEIPGIIHFPSERTLILDDLKARSVKFDTFNGTNSHDFLNSVPNVAPKHAIKNKTFFNLAAENVLLHVDGKLNGIPFVEMLGRVVNLNTAQKILSEKTFLSPIHFERAFTLGLNGKELSSFVNNIVFTDEISSVVSPKEFERFVETDNVFIHGLVNGIDLNTLYSNVFSKSSDNQIKPSMSFFDDIRVGKLVTGSLDGMKWDDLIFNYQDEILDSVWFQSGIVLQSHLVVAGLLNKCDLAQLGQRALYAKETNQLITEEITIQSIYVVGNLNLAKIVNEISMEDLHRKFVSISGNQIVTADVELGNGFKVVSLDLRDLANHVDIPLVMSDAVRHSFPQEITGYKRFQDLRNIILTATEVFITESLDGVDVNELYENAVWKVGHQVVEGEKIFHSIKTDVATIEGYINGLRLPHDVVRTDTTDHILSPVFFMSDVVLGSDVAVDGRLDGVLIPRLMQSLVTLTGEDLVRSRLSFMRDTTLYGETTVDGTVNDIVLEVVLKVKPHIPLEGHKAFIHPVHVLGDLSATAVNGYDIQEMDRSILRVNEKEFLKELQVFKKHVKVQNSLFTEWINNISIPQMVTAYSSIARNLNQTLNYFDDLTFGFQQQISHQIQATGNKISRFAYFILIQDISIGPITKILHGYRLEHASSEFSHSMVLWRLQRHCIYMEQCCHVEFSHWMRVKKSGTLIDSGAKPGRFYPIHNPAPVTFDKDFVIWTNTTEVQPKWCGTRDDETMSLASLTEAGNLQVFMNIMNSPILSEVKSFRRGHLYAVAGYFYDRKDDEYSSAVVYVFNEMKRGWSEHQILPSFGVISLDVTDYMYGSDMELLLAVGTGTSTYSSVYRWNGMEHGFDLLQNIPSTYVTSTLWVKQGSTQLLAMASVEQWPTKGEECLEYLSGGQVNIYIYDGKVRWIQSIPLRGVVSMISFDFEGDTFLVVASHQLQTVFIYEWKGFVGFREIQSMFVGEVRHLNTYTIGEDRYMTVAVTSGPSKLLKVVLQGRHNVAATIKMDPPSQDDQKDEASKEDKFVSGC